jgi:hypothetical protein
MRKFIPLLTTILLLTISGIAAACPMCKDSIPNSDAQQVAGLPIGFNNSIYLMLSGFIAVLGMMGFICFKGITGAQGQSGFPIVPLKKKNDESEKNDLTGK